MLCPKCKERERRPGQGYCRPCATKYKLANEKEMRARMLAKAHREGAESMRIAAIKRFEELSDLGLNGRTAADILRRILPDLRSA